MNRLKIDANLTKGVEVSTVVGCGILYLAIQNPRKPLGTLNLKASYIKSKKLEGYQHFFLYHSQFCLLNWQEQ